MPSKRYEVLVVDDNPGDLRLLQEAIVSISAPINIIACQSASDALAILADRDDIDLILSDLNMHGTDGIQLFERLQHCPRLRAIPMAIMSSSDRTKLPKPIMNKIRVPYFTKASTWPDFITLAQELLASVSSCDGAATTPARMLAERMTPTHGFSIFTDVQSPPSQRP